MGISWTSVVCFFSAMASCCKRCCKPSPPLEHSIDVPQPSQLPEITEPGQLDRFIVYIEGLLAAQKSSHQSAPSSSNAGAEFSAHIKFAADTMETISSEAEKVQKSTGGLTSKLPEEARRIVTDALSGLGNLHWIGVAFSMAAYVLQNMHRVSSNLEECMQLLEKIVELAKILQKLSKRMPDEKQKLERAVHTIVEGAIICCCYRQERTIFRYFTAQTVGETLKDTRDNLNNLISELSLLVTMDIQAQQPRRLEQRQNILQISEPVGMEEPFEKVKGLLDMESSGTAKAVIIYGFGGLGKTTLAEYVVSKLPLDGFKVCVIRVDEINLDIKKLQEQILFDAEGKKIDLRDFIEGQSRLKDALKDQLCFLLIDNIVDKDRVRDLLPREFSLPSKSRILLTSRKNDVREVLPHTIECREYLVEGLPSEKSVELLRQKVFTNNVQHETSDDERMIKDLAEACGGVPLLLTVFGEHLRVDRSKQAYEEALRSLKEGERGRYVEEGLGEKLLYVYHKMKNQDAKEAFLDICTFFHGWPKGTVSFIVGEDELKLLQEGALVKITESNEVIVHDVLRSLGIKEGKATRLRLQSTDNLLSALDDDEEEKALEKMKGIWFDRENTSEILSLESKHLNKMCKSLRALNLGDGIVLEGQCQGKFKHLRFLQVGNLSTFPFKDASKLEKLTVFHNMSEAVSKLELDGLPQTLKELKIFRPPPYKKFVVHPSWWRHIKYLTNLQVLELSTLTSIKFPQDFVLPASLRELDLIDCEHLENLPQGFGQLTSLTDLTLKRCCGLSSLPTDFGGLRSLKRLSIDGCVKVTELPHGFGQLTSLTDVSLEYCPGLSTLPADFGGLRSLKCLRIQSCDSLTELPQEFGQLTYLTDVSLKFCSGLSTLSADFGGLRSLKCLGIEYCERLTELPQGFGHLTSLTELTLLSLDELHTIPADFGGLRSLKRLSISHCRRLTELPAGFGQLTSLTDLTLVQCHSLRTLDIGGLRSLERLRIYWCEGLTELPQGLGQLTWLTDLTLELWRDLSTLPADFGGLHSLKRLTISQFYSLTELPQGFGQLTSLTDLSLNNCYMLSALSADFEGLRSLKCLRIHLCHSLPELPQGFGQLTSLTDLTLDTCSGLSTLSADFGGLRSLKRLSILRCERLTELPQGFGRLTSLTDLSLVVFPNLKRLPNDFENLTSLTCLRLFDCPMLEAETMEKVVKLENLRELDIEFCPSLGLKWKEMPNKENYRFRVAGCR